MGVPRASKRLIMSGLYPATVTPFHIDGTLDYEGLRQHLVETVETPGVEGVVVNSGLGELLQLSAEEKRRCIELAVELCKPEQLVIAGIEGHNPELIIEDGLAAKAAGAEALLVFPPFDRRAYRKLAKDPGSVYNVFSRLDAEIDLPMVVFQYPPNSGCAYSVEALEAIAELDNVVAIKAATAGDFDAYVEVWDALNTKLSVLVGVDSPPLLAMLRHGSHGALIGISAVATWAWVDLLALVEKGDTSGAEALFNKVCRPLMASIFEDQQPKRLTSEAAAMKEALFQLGSIANPKARMPAFPTGGEVQSEIRQSLEDAGLLAKDLG